MNTNLRTIDLNLLVIFEAVYATGNTGKAAMRLGMSQPSVSNALTRLRDQIGDPLFVRTPHGVEPTMKAKELIEPVREALGIIGGKVVDTGEIELATYRRVFRVIISDVLESVAMPKIVRTISEQARGIKIECIQGRANFEEDLRAGTLDLACFSYPGDTSDLTIMPIESIDFVVVTRRNHPQIKKPLDLETFARLSHIAFNRELRALTTVNKSLTANALELHVAYMVAKAWSIPPMIERTDLIGILPRNFVEEISDNFDLDVHDVPIDLPEQHHYMTWHVNSDNDPGHKWLRESIMSAMKRN